MKKVEALRTKLPRIPRCTRIACVCASFAIQPRAGSSGCSRGKEEEVDDVDDDDAASKHDAHAMDCCDNGSLVEMFTHIMHFFVVSRLSLLTGTIKHGG